MSQLRREIVRAPILPDEEYIQRWQEVKYDGKAFAEDAQEIVTERGERVRSKSEKHGIYLGVNLFVTYETSKKVLNTRVVDGFLRRLFVKE